MTDRVEFNVDSLIENAKRDNSRALAQLAIIAQTGQPENSPVGRLCRNALKKSYQRGYALAKQIIAVSHPPIHADEYTDLDMDWPLLKQSAEMAIHTKLTPLLCRESPKLWVIDELIGTYMCAYLQVTSFPQLRRSTVRSPDASEDVMRQGRKSREATWPVKGDDPVYWALCKRLAMQAEYPLLDPKTISVIRYEPGDRFDPHYDERRRAAQSRPAFRRETSVICYLNDDFEGGETIFPHARFKINPKIGMGVFFNNFLENDEIDPATLHSGAPVLNGNKWTCVMWLYTPWKN